MPRSTYSTLMDAIQTNNSRQFRSILQTEGLPEGLWWLDYDLLRRALDLNRQAIVGYLLESRCCVWKPYDKTTPLHIAVAKVDWHNIVDKLLCLGARVSAKNAAGDTPVHVAFKHDAPTSILDMLIQSYLDETTVSICNKEELGVLHIACTRPKLKFVCQFFQFHRKSIDSQVSFNSNSSYAGYTPLHFAVEHGRHEVVAYLLERSADLYLQDRNGSTPLHLALEYCDIKMINLLCEYVTKFEDIVNSRGLSHFMAACASNDPSLVEKYLSESSPETLINSRVKDTNGYPFAGYTPLHFAAVYDRVHIARLLLYCHGETLFWAATARNHTASSLAFEKKRYRIAKLFSMYCRGGEVWMKQVKKIDEASVVRKMIEEAEEDSFFSCCNFDVSEKIVETERRFAEEVESNECDVSGELIECDVSEEIRMDECDVGENLDDTLSIDEYSDDDDEDFLIDVDACSEQIVDQEAVIQVTPVSTQSLHGKRDEVFMTRVHNMHWMSKRLFFNINREENEQSDSKKVFDFLFSVRFASIIVGTLFLLSLSLIVPIFVPTVWT